MLRRRIDGWFDPAVVGACERRARRHLQRARGRLRLGCPARRRVDAAGHAAGLARRRSCAGGRRPGRPEVAVLPRALARRRRGGGGGRRGLGLGEDETTAVRRAGLFHDLGRVGVSNLVWDKPGPLTAAEWEQVRLHAYHTERILARSSVLEPLAQLAGMHHERTDGSGYHRGVTAVAIPIGARVLAAADVFQALTETRPHRPARSPEQAAQEVAAMVAAGALDPEAARAVCDAAGVSLRRGPSVGSLAGRTDRPRGRGATAARPGFDEEGDRQRTRDRARDSTYPHGPHLRKARRLDAGWRRPLRIGARPGLAARSIERWIPPFGDAS